MQRRIVKLGFYAVLKIKHVERHLAAGHDNRPLAGDPALIECLAVQSDPGGRSSGSGGRLGHGRLVQGRVEDADDLPADLERIGDVDDVLKDRRDAGRQGRLAVAGRPEEQHTAAGIHGRQQLADVVLRHDESCEALT